MEVLGVVEHVYLNLGNRIKYDYCESNDCIIDMRG